MERAMGIEPTSEGWEAYVASSRKAGSQMVRERPNPWDLVFFLFASKSLERRCQSARNLVRNFRRFGFEGTTREQ